MRLFQQSSIATGRLLQKCGTTLIKDCPTRWQMVRHLFDHEGKDHIAPVAGSMTRDSLQTSEWQNLVVLKDLLLPFAEHNKVLESDTNSFCLVVPALLHLKGHLSEFSQTHARSDNIADVTSFLDVTNDNKTNVLLKLMFREKSLLKMRMREFRIV